MTPMDQRSTSFPYPCLFKTSGATYPGVPQAVFITSSSLKIFDKPKSLIITFPFFVLSDNKRFSGYIFFKKKNKFYI